MTDHSTLMIEQEDLISKESSYFFQIDLLKAIMIFLVIFDHMVSWNIKDLIGVALWERISIPVFLLILGFNMGYSLRNQNAQSLRQLYSKEYFKKKFFRYLVPFLLLYVFSTFIGLFMYGFDFTSMFNYQFSPNHGFTDLFYLIMPFWGPGNWFIPVLFQSILLMPILYWGIIKKPKTTLILSLLIEFSTQILAFFIVGDITTWEELHLFSLFGHTIFFYLTPVALGMWFSFGYKLNEKRNRFMWIFFPISLLFIIAYQFFEFRIRIDDVPLLRGDYHFLFIGYSALILLVTLRYIPRIQNNKISKGISLIGKSTYHILLLQILGYAMITAWWGTHYGIDIPFNPFDIIDLLVLWVIFVSFGVLWYKIDKVKDLRRRVLFYLNLFIVFSSLFLLSFWMQGFWIPIPLMFIIFYSIVALISYVFNREPVDTFKLLLWTGFLVLNFFLMIIEVTLLSMIQPILFLIPSTIYLIIVTCHTQYD